MIIDISQILSFRHNPKYCNDSWWSPMIYNVDFDKFLKSYPKIYHDFYFIIDSEHNFLKFNNKSNNVFCNSLSASTLIQKLNYSDRFCNLIIAGDDNKLSSNIDLLKKIRHNFKKIYYEAKDIECDWVQTIPMGMIMAYMLRNGGNKTIISQINKKKNKSKLIATAFGSKWPSLTEVIPDRHKLNDLTSSSSLIDNVFCEPSDFYKTLCDYKFFASPLGNGIQTPKICESIMCETVPVVTNHVAHRELRDFYKLPILIVEDWRDLSKNFLDNAWNSEYKFIDWNAEKSKFLTKNFCNLLN